jgi:hypothetical protein
VIVAVALLMAACGGTAGRSAAPAGGSEAAQADSGSHQTGTPDPAPAPLRAGERFTALTMATSYTPAAPTGGTDDYRCFLLDPELTQPTWLAGSQFLPDNSAIVHHAILFRVPPADVGTAEQADAASAGPGWTCFGDAGLPGARAGVNQLEDAPWLAAWAPGGGESISPDGTAVQLAAGSRIVLQVHYNLLAAGKGKGTVSDRSSVRLRLAPGTVRREPLNTRLLVAPVELPCAPSESGPLCDRTSAVNDVISRFGLSAGRTVAGLQLLCGGSFIRPKAGPVQSCDRRVSEPGVIRAIAGHMHLLGKAIKVELNPGTARARTLLDVTSYDFDNQGAVKLPQPAAVATNDTLRVTCTHDVTQRQKLPTLRSLPPRYVVWGEGTSDEMCLGIVMWSRK